MTDILDVSTTPQQTPIGLPKEHGGTRDAVPLAVDVEMLAKPGYAQRKKGQRERVGSGRRRRPNFSAF